VGRADQSGVGLVFYIQITEAAESPCPRNMILPMAARVPQSLHREIVILQEETSKRFPVWDTDQAKVVVKAQYHCPQFSILIRLEPVSKVRFFLLY
jgi:hypothetical protein